MGRSSAVGRRASLGLVVGLGLGLNGSVAQAQSGPAVPIVTVPSVEVYYGITKIYPPAPEPVAVARPSAIVPVSATAAPATGQALVQLLHSFRDAARTVSGAANVVMETASDRAAQPSEPRTMAWAGASTGPVTAARDTIPPPQVVVVRESSTSAILAAIGVAGVGLFLAANAWGRFGRKSVLVAAGVNDAAPPSAAAPPTDPPMVPVAGERFDLGSSYQDETRAKQAAEERQAQAAAQLILEQNLAFLSAIDPQDGSVEASVSPNGSGVVPIRL